MNYNAELEKLYTAINVANCKRNELRINKKKIEERLLNLDCENVDISDPETDCRAFHRIGDRFVKDTVPEREEDRKG